MEEPELSKAVSLLASDVPTLVREGVNVAKLEARALGTRAGVLTASACVAIIGFLLASTGVAFLISQTLERAWAGPLIVGVALVAFAAATTAIALLPRRT
jgi:hypothetical protein